MKALGNETNLIICQKSKITDWIDHIKEYYNYPVYDLTVSKQMQAFYQAYLQHNTAVGIINYDLLFRRDILKNLHGFTMILDESSMIQNTQAKRTKSVLNLKAENVILLSGTPTGGKYENLYSQIKLLGWDITEKPIKVNM